MRLRPWPFRPRGGRPRCASHGESGRGSKQLAVGSWQLAVAVADLTPFAGAKPPLRKRRGGNTKCGGEVTAGSGRGSTERRKIGQNPYKIPHFKAPPDERRKSPCSKIAAPKPVAGALAGRYGGGIIIAPEYTPAAGVCRSPGARGARDSSPIDRRTR